MFWRPVWPWAVAVGYWSVSRTDESVFGKRALCVHWTGAWVVLTADVEAVANNLSYISFIKINYLHRIWLKIYLSNWPAVEMLIKFVSWEKVILSSRLVLKWCKVLHCCTWFFIKPKFHYHPPASWLNNNAIGIRVCSAIFSLESHSGLQ